MPNDEAVGDGAHGSVAGEVRRDGPAAKLWWDSHGRAGRCSAKLPPHINHVTL